MHVGDGTSRTGLSVLTQILLTELTLDGIYTVAQYKLTPFRAWRARKLAQIPDRVNRIIDVQHFVIVEGSHDVEHAIDGLDV